MLRKRSNPRDVCIEVLRQAIALSRGTRWPDERYAKDPVGFVKHVLGEKYVFPHQVAILESARDNFKVAVRSGQKTGKTKLVIWLALWWYCTRSRGRVFMLAAIKEQIQRVLWAELRNTIQDAGKAAGFEIDEAVPINPASGIVSSDGREIRGITTREIEAMAGISGDILFIVDEASALQQTMAEAVEGNLAGDGRMIWISNPTRTTGPYYDVFSNSQKGQFWRQFHVNSETVAEYCTRHGIDIRGVANAKRIEEWAKEYGKDHAFYIMRVLGNFVLGESGSVIPMHDIMLSQKAHVDTPEEGELTLGIDPAGAGPFGDEFAIAAVRGKKQVWMQTWRGLSEEAALVQIHGLFDQLRQGNEIPRANIDAEGAIGSSLYGRLRAISETLKQSNPKKAFDVFAVRAGQNAKRQPDLYVNVRDELWAGAAKWIKDGGAIIPDSKLEVELHAPMWLGANQNRVTVTHKDKLRDMLQRSTDRADALLLAVWEPVGWIDTRWQGMPAEPTRVGAEEVGIRAGLVPYDNAFDPY